MVYLHEMFEIEAIEHLQGCKVIGICQSEDEEGNTAIDLALEGKEGKKHYLSFADNGCWYYGNEDTK